MRMRISSWIQLWEYCTVYPKLEELEGRAHWTQRQDDACEHERWHLAGAAGKGQAIAKVCSPVTYKDFLPDDFDRNDYIVEIPPGVDSALVIAMVLAYEKMEQSYD